MYFWPQTIFNDFFPIILENQQPNVVGFVHRLLTLFAEKLRINVFIEESSIELFFVFRNQLEKKFKELGSNSVTAKEFNRYFFFCFFFCCKYVSDRHFYNNEFFDFLEDEVIKKGLDITEEEMGEYRDEFNSYYKISLKQLASSDRSPNAVSFIMYQNRLFYKILPGFSYYYLLDASADELTDYINFMITTHKNYHEAQKNSYRDWKMKNIDVLSTLRKNLIEIANSKFESEEKKSDFIENSFSRYCTENFGLLFDQEYEPLINEYKEEKKEIKGMLFSLLKKQLLKTNTSSITENMYQKQIFIDYEADILSDFDGKYIIDVDQMIARTGFLESDLKKKFICFFYLHFSYHCDLEAQKAFSPYMSKAELRILDSIVILKKYFRQANIIFNNNNDIFIDSLVINSIVSGKSSDLIQTINELGKISSYNSLKETQFHINVIRDNIFSLLFGKQPLIFAVLQTLEMENNNAYVVNWLAKQPENLTVYGNEYIYYNENLFLATYNDECLFIPINDHVKFKNFLEHVHLKTHQNGVNRLAPNNRVVLTADEISQLFENNAHKPIKLNPELIEKLRTSIYKCLVGNNDEAVLNQLASEIAGSEDMYILSISKLLFDLYLKKADHFGDVHFLVDKAYQVKNYRLIYEIIRSVAYLMINKKDTNEQRALAKAMNYLKEKFVNTPEINDELVGNIRTVNQRWSERASFFSHRPKRPMICSAEIQAHHLSL